MESQRGRVKQSGFCPGFVGAGPLACGYCAERTEHGKKGDTAGDTASGGGFAGAVQTGRGAADRAFTVQYAAVPGSAGGFVFCGDAARNRHAGNIGGCLSGRQAALRPIVYGAGRDGNAGDCGFWRVVAGCDGHFRAGFESDKRNPAGSD